MVSGVALIMEPQHNALYTSVHRNCMASFIDWVWSETNSRHISRWFTPDFVPRNLALNKNTAVPKVSDRSAGLD